MDTTLTGLPPSFSSPLPLPKCPFTAPAPTAPAPASNSAPCTLRHAPCTMHHAPCTTLRPCCCTTRPAPCTLLPCTTRLTAPRPLCVPIVYARYPCTLSPCALLPYLTYIPTPTCTMFIYISCSPPSSLSCPPGPLMMQARRTVSQSHLGCRAHPGPSRPGLQTRPLHIASC